MKSVGRKNREAIIILDFSAGWIKRRKCRRQIEWRVEEFDTQTGVDQPLLALRLQ